MIPKEVHEEILNLVKTMLMDPNCLLKWSRPMIPEDVGKTFLEWFPGNRLTIRFDQGPNSLSLEAYVNQLAPPTTWP